MYLIRGMNISFLILIIHIIQCNSDEKKTQDICDDDEAVMEIVVRASDAGEPIVEPKCKPHSPIGVDHCDGLFRPEMNESSYLRKLPFKERMLAKKRIYKSCLSKENEIRKVHRSSKDQQRQSRKLSNSRTNPFRKDHELSCPTNKTSQFVSIGAKWGGSTNLKMKCQHVACVWDCIDVVQSVELSSDSITNITAENVYTAKYNLTDFKDAFFASFEIFGVGDGAFAAKYRICRDCSGFVPHIPAGPPALVISQPCPELYIELETGCCLQYHSTRMQFANARVACQSRGADLVVVRDTYTFNYIADMISSWTWVGHESNGAPNYLSSDGSTYTKSQLESIATNGVKNYVSQGCVEIRPSQRDFYVDECGTWSYPYMCGINC